MDAKTLRSLSAMTLLAFFVGCELFKEPTPKAAAGSAKSVAPGANPTTSNAPATGGPAVWKKHTLVGVTFESPFELTYSQEATTRMGAGGAAFTAVEAYEGSLGTWGPESGLKMVLSRAKGPAHLGANVENALRQANRNMARNANDANPTEEVKPAQLGAVSGFVSALVVHNPDGRERAVEAVGAASSESHWQIMVMYEDKSQRDTAKKIIASISIQP